MSSADASSRWRPLSGGTAIWVFMAVELVTFGLFLIVHAWGWRTEPEAYQEGQALLHPASGLRGTLLLLLGSGFVYQGVLQGGRRAGAWFVGGASTGVAFVINKLAEYADPALDGVGLSTSSFWFGALFLTGLHLLHVAVGIVALPWLGLQAWRGVASSLDLEAGAAYWHLVDVIWVLIFPILYLMHP